MAQPDLVKFSMGYDSANGSDEDARNFARRAIQLAERTERREAGHRMNTQQRLDASMEFMERSNQEFNPGGNTMIAAELLWGAYAQLSLAVQNSEDGRH